MNNARAKASIVTRARDTGDLQLTGALVEGVRFEHCALSVGSTSKRATFTDCTFRDLSGNANVVGTAMFKRCRFENIDGGDHVQLQAAAFVECSVTHLLKSVTFGFDAKGVYPPATIQSNKETAAASSFCLDITDADLRDVGFAGEDIAKKVRFRPGQCLVLSGKGLQEKLLPLVKAATNGAFAELLAPAASSSRHTMNLTVVPQELKADIGNWIAQIEATGVSVRSTALC